MQKHLPEPHRKTCSALNPGTEPDVMLRCHADVPCTRTHYSTVLRL
ncbi:MAG: hypothetical protein J6B71_09060 [Clostridia bacterium]|nr:hypothetical protein [Clostridia bacterium]